MGGTRLRYGIVLVVISALGLGAVIAADWPHWRGPDYNGSTAETGLPASWSKTEKVAWTVDLPGIGSATPIIAGDRVFLASMSDGKKGDCVGMCISVEDGEVLWQHKLGKGKRGRRHSPAACSPVADDKRAYFLFGTGLLAAVNRDGEIAWKRDLAKEYGGFKILWDYAASPLLYDGRLYVPVLHRKGDKGSFVLAIDPDDGETVWKITRPTKATGESQEAYTTPIPYETDGVKGVLIAGGEAVTLHNPETGKEMWRYEHGSVRNGRLVTTPTPMNGFVCCGLPQGNASFVLKVGGAGAKKAWTTDGQAEPDVTTSAYHDGKLYVLDGRQKILTCWDTKTGKKVGSNRIGGATYWASPTVADGKVYCIDQKGKVTVCRADASLEQVGEASMGEKGCHSTIAVADGRLYVRTPSKLYCIAGGE